MFFNHCSDSADLPLSVEESVSVNVFLKLLILEVFSVLLVVAPMSGYNGTHLVACAVQNRYTIIYSTIHFVEGLPTIGVTSE